MELDDADHPTRRRRGLLIVLSSPSGAGKTTISRMLMESDRDITMSISATTRPKRPGETDDVDYHFVDDAEFDRMIRDNEFVEWAHVFGYRYGTPKAPVKRALRRGRDILFDIDWQGARQLVPDFKEHLVTIFLLPPSMEELERRLRARGTDSDEVIVDRMRRATDEINHWAEYEYVLVNRDTDECLTQVRSIVEAERLRQARHAELDPFVRQLIGPAH
ncbi:guanylate kinase [Sphingomonas sediminicola]|jgi:guanylate kinase|uniref:Guanylate kinase n=1 Tax=Sphingomonas sediminicola TaxID=386874 RepID=A0ABX6TAP8_9SPHN|nr:guanylate kinase [Sphingomonas sediminicola]QNP46017.1 guanylate kinase [Sphingomonas sediminicola]